MNHHLVMSDSKIKLQGVTTFVGRSTNYIGGVFKLNAGSEVWVTTDLHSAAYLTNKESSFLGAFLLQAI